ncbi:hypothetical protein DSECCO2_604770 [anaerobic digester metagenome]
MKTSYIVGLVLARSSVGSSRLSGDIMKKSVDAIRLMTTIIPRFLRERLRSKESFIPTAIPVPMIGPISGEISMAPIITGVEFTLSPTEATITANARIQTLGPLKSIFFLILSIVPVISTWSAKFAISFTC